MKSVETGDFVKNLLIFTKSLQSVDFMKNLVIFTKDAPNPYLHHEILIRCKIGSNVKIQRLHILGPKVGYTGSFNSLKVPAYI